MRPRQSVCVSHPALLDWTALVLEETARCSTRRSASVDRARQADAGCVRAAGALLSLVLLLLLLLVLLLVLMLLLVRRGTATRVTARVAGI